MEVQLRSIKHECCKYSTVDYNKEFAECIIKDGHTRKCIIERYTNNYTTHKEKLDRFVLEILMIISLERLNAIYVIIQNLMRL